MRRSRLVALAVALTLPLLAGLQSVPASGAAAAADTYASISGSGSTWSQVALDQWSKDVKQNGITVNYNGTGSSAGRSDFAQGVTDFGVSEIPFQSHPEDHSTPEDPRRPFSYMPIVAGGTSFMYHLTQNGKRVDNLRLSGDTIAKIFTGQIKNWNDPAITKDMGGVAMPSKKITPVLRSDGSGTTAQFTLWMSKEYPSIWQGFSHKTGLTSYYPNVPGGKAQNGSNGVANYVSASYGDGAIGYVEYAYALNAGYPAVKVLNKSGYYVLPTASNVGVALLQAQIDQQSGANYLTQILDGVYAASDKRAYPLSSYSYMIVQRDKATGIFNAAKGKTLSTFINYFLCSGQQKAPELGYSPLPKNLVVAALQQVAHIPGHINVSTSDAYLQTCNNPTFKGGKNTLIDTAPFPQACDKAGSVPCGSTSGGAGGNTNKGNQTANPTANPSGLNGPNGLNNQTGPNGQTGPVSNAFAEPVQVGARSGFGPAIGFVSAGVLLAALLVPPVLTAFLRGRRRRTRPEDPRS
jgi:phosphate transport system substrate-binding protein